MTLPTITNKQQSILTLLYRFRFLNRTQIQTILKHKHHKRIIDWLKDLNEKDYIGKIYSNKLGENTKPTIYYIGQNGIKYLRALEYPTEQIKKLYREKERSENFIKKHLLIADICLDLQSVSTDEIRYAALTVSDFLNPGSNYNFLSELNPDFALVKDSEDMKKYYLLEILEPTLPLYSVKKRIKNYFDFYFSNSWEDNTGEEFPKVILICETLPMVMGVRKIVKGLVCDYDEIELIFDVILKQEISSNSIFAIL